MLAANVDPKAFVSRPPFIGSIWFLASYLRSKAFVVGYDPLPDNPYHGEVWGTFSKGRQRDMLATAQWFVQITGVDLTAT